MLQRKRTGQRAPVSGHQGPGYTTDDAPGILSAVSFTFPAECSLAFEFPHNVDFKVGEEILRSRKSLWSIK
jgi:predicted AlkP superfamily pyrophosphatase or phosphodiesterase